MIQPYAIGLLGHACFNQVVELTVKVESASESFVVSQDGTSHALASASPRIERHGMSAVALQAMRCLQTGDSPCHRRDSA